MMILLIMQAVRLFAMEQLFYNVTVANAMENDLSSASSLSFRSRVTFLGCIRGTQLKSEDYTEIDDSQNDCIFLDNHRDARRTQAATIKRASRHSSDSKYR